MRRRGFTLISTLLTVAIILILAVVMLKGGLGGTWSDNTGAPARADGKGTTLPGLMKLAAEDTTCQNNLAQVRQGLAIAQIGTDYKPQSIEEARIGSQFYKCPVGDEPYSFDPASGEVKCVHPGHEKY